MLDLSKPVQTRAGRRVRIYTDNHPGPSPSIVGGVEEFGGTWTLHTWHQDGTSYYNKEDPYDLVNRPETKTVAGYLILWKNDMVSFTKQMPSVHGGYEAIKPTTVTFTLDQE